MKERSSTKSKAKNPLYVVKGKDVQEASDMLDFVIKKLNLAPLMKFVQNMLAIIMDNMKSYPTFVAMKNFLDQLMGKLLVLFQKFA